MHAKCRSCINVCAKVIKESGAIGSGANAIHGQVVNVGVWLAHLDFVAVNNGVEDGFKIHEGPPHITELLHVVRQNGNGEPGCFQVMDECNHLVIELKVECTSTSGGCGCGGNNAGGVEHVFCESAALGHGDLAAF